MRYTDILLERNIPSAVSNMSDEDRLAWMKFLIDWLSGAIMQKVTSEHVARWEEFSRLFPTGLIQPIKLYRVMTVPKEYTTLKDRKFTIKTPAPGLVGSWTSTKIGMDCVAGVAREFVEMGSKLEGKTARIGIKALIEPQNV